MKQLNLDTLENLNTVNAGTAATVISATNPEWGSFPFHYNAQELNDNIYAHIIGTGSDSRVLSNNELQHWKIASYKVHKVELNTEDKFPHVAGGPGAGKSYSGPVPLKFGNPLPFPLAINDDWVRIQCGVDGNHNYIFGIDGLKEFYAAGAGKYSRGPDGKPADSLEYWITWYENEKNERINVSSGIDKIKELLPKILNENKEPDFELVKASYSYTIVRNQNTYYIEAYKINAQKWIAAGAVTKEYTEKYPFIFQVFDSLDENRKAINSTALTADEFHRLPYNFRKFIVQLIPRVKKAKSQGIKF